MALRRVEFVLCLVLVTALASQTAAQSGCATAMMNLSPCLTFITGNSTSPSPNCCSQLSNVVQSSPSCLCSVVNGAAASFGIQINRTQALALPNACNIVTPPLSQCQAANTPTASPIPVADSPGETPDAASTPTASDNPTLGGGSKSVPSTDGSSSATTITSINAILFLFFMLSCSSNMFIF